MKRKTTPPNIRFFSKVNKTPTCWLWTAATCGPGYGNFWNGKRIQMAHRYSYELHNGVIPKDSVIMHTCDVMLCVNPKHLIIGTQKDNLRDMYTKGRQRARDTYIQQAGEKAWNSSLSNKDAQRIRLQYRNTKTSSLKLAAEYKVSKTTILNVLKGKTYVENNAL